MTSLDARRRPRNGKANVYAIRRCGTRSAGLEARKAVRKRQKRLILVAILVAVSVAALQAYISSSDTQYLARPLKLEPGSRLVAFEATGRTVTPGQSVRVKLFISGHVPRRPITVLFTPTIFSVEPPGTPSMNKRLIGTRDLRSVEVSAVVPTWVRGGAFSLRLPGQSRTFGEFAVLSRGPGNR